jgi:hypothetical protein
MGRHARPGNLCTRLLGTILSIALSQPVGAEGAYKWVDNSGQTHYGDRIPPEASAVERKMLNEQGVTVKVYDAAKTPEQLAEEQRLARLQQEQERRSRKQAIHDRALLATFTNEEDMILARDGKTAAIDGVILLAQKRIDTLGERLEEMTAGAAQLERSGRAFPESLHREIQDTRLQIRQNEEYIRSKRAEQAAIREQFEADISRFRELKAEMATVAD